MGRLRIYGALLIVAFVLVIIIQNVGVVEVNLLFYTLFMPKATLIGVSLFIGMILGIVFATFRRRR
jgi:uncharacterized integral membrane protein